MRVGEKFDAFLDNIAEVEFLEGTTAAGKTTVGIYKFMLEVAENPKKAHIIAGLDTGTIEKNIINKDNGIMDEWGALVEYNGNGTSEEKLPHIEFKPRKGVKKIIYILGYDDKRRWKKALGGQYGCLYIDELNIADMDFVREAAMRCDYLLATMNPDDPNLPVYKEYVNCSRPLPEWAADTPKEILDELKEEAKPGWVHWFFSFKDNISLTKEKLDKIIRNVPVGTKLYKNKVQGLRGKATGLVFVNFNRQRHIRNKEWAKQFIKNESNKKEYFVYFTAGLDTAYSQKSEDTIAMSFSGITNKGRYVLLDERVYNNANLDRPIAPSDTVVNYMAFLERNREEWGFAKNTFIDSADQATITEFAKYKKQHNGCMYMFNNAYKKIEITNRIHLQLGWMSYNDEAGIEPCFFVLDHCKNAIHEMETYSWLEDKDNTPEDRNDHMINSMQYGWIPYKDKIFKQGEV